VQPNETDDALDELFAAQVAYLSEREAVIEVVVVVRVASRALQGALACDLDREGRRTTGQNTAPGADDFGFLQKRSPVRDGTARPRGPGTSADRVFHDRWFYHSRTRSGQSPQARRLANRLDVNPITSSKAAHVRIERGKPCSGTVGLLRSRAEDNQSGSTPRTTVRVLQPHVRERMRTLWQVMGCGVRRVLKKSGVTCFGVLPLVLGIGANTAVAFSAESSIQQPAARLTLEPIVFEVRDKEKVEAELGRLLVPDNRANPRAKLISLAFIGFKVCFSSPARAHSSRDRKRDAEIIDRFSVPIHL
jgi:hypothetical protein